MSKNITTWEYSTQIEAKRVIHIAYHIVTGFFRLNGYVVVPDTYKGDLTPLVTFPDIDYGKVSKFWDKVKRMNIKTLPVNAPEPVVAGVTALLKQYTIKEPSFQDVRGLWSQVEGPFIEALGNIIPAHKNSIKKINVYPSLYGTRASFNLTRSIPCEIHIHLREDSDIYALASAILLSITRNQVFKKYKGLWSESQLLVDWLIEETPFFDILSSAQPLRKTPSSMSVVREYFDRNALLASENFYKKLGVRREKSVFEFKGKKMYADNKLLQRLSPNELKLLRLLVEHRGDTVSVNEISDALFKSDDEFSLYAIAKNIERLRKKLEFNGITGSYIKTVRGEGYMLR